MIRILTLCLAGILLAACAASRSGDETAAVPATHVSVSGLSSGGYMAVQLHLAHNDIIDGAGILAAGPYACAEGNLMRALGPCVGGGAVDPTRSIELAQRAAQANQIAALSHLDGDRVWLFHGSRDTAVGRSVVDALASAYRGLGVPPDGIHMETEIPAAHGFPVTSSTLACDLMQSPFLNSCDFDAAGELLVHILAAPSTVEKSPVSDERLTTFAQQSPPDSGLADSGFVYRPRRCEEEACGLHIALHGCSQGQANVGNAFASRAGYNAWAEAFGMVIVYPQVQPDAVRNPLGCWDWWGYTGADYATRDAVQIVALRAIIERHRQGTL